MGGIGQEESINQLIREGVRDEGREEVLIHGEVLKMSSCEDLVIKFVV